LKGSFADRLATAIGTGLYSGYFPIFPGTAGSVAGILLYLILVGLGVLAEAHSAAWIVVLGLLFAGGVASAHRCEALFGHDNKRIVIDEIWGMVIALYALPFSWKWMLAAFVVFRLFDIVKPFPAGRAEKIGGGLAIMLDDGVAGAYTAAALHIFRYLTG
jgi:phosphatidylglycerophosphatase A